MEQPSLLHRRCLLARPTLALRSHHPRALPFGHPLPRSCQAPVTKLERIAGEGGGIFISPATLQGYRSEAELARHLADMQGRLAALAAAGGGVLGGLEGLSASHQPPPLAAQQQQLQTGRPGQTPAGRF